MGVPPFLTETGFNYYYHRYYYPQVGRFINEDPIGLKSDLNLFEFVKNNPLNFFDLYGLQLTEDEIEQRTYRPTLTKPERIVDSLRVLTRAPRSLTNPKMQCCIAEKVAKKAARKVFTAIGIHLLVEIMLEHLHELSHVILIPETLHVGQELSKLTHEAWIECMYELDLW